MHFTNQTDKLVLNLDNKTKMCLSRPNNIQKNNDTKNSTCVCHMYTCTSIWPLTIYSLESKEPGMAGRPKKNEMHERDAWTRCMQVVQTPHLLHVVLTLWNPTSYKTGRFFAESLCGEIAKKSATKNIEQPLSPRSWLEVFVGVAFLFRTHSLTAWTM